VGAGVSQLLIGNFARVRSSKSAAVTLRQLSQCVLAAALLSCLGSCATLGPDTSAAAATAIAFHQAVAAGDGAAACALLAPETATEVSDTADEPCPDAVVTQDIPEAEAVRDSQAFGRSAQVVMDGDVLFLAIFDGQWKITAAGCQSRADQPYDCQVRG
jgi:hypothetical protein